MRDPVKRAATKQHWREKNPTYHSDYSREWAKRRKENGICYQCSNPKLDTDSSRCLYHWAYGIARKSCNRHDKPFIELLIKKLENQNYQCALTGITLIPGINASLDHIQPKSKGGSNELENLRWVDHKVNFIKHDMSDEELFAMCEAILSNRSTGG